MVACFTVASRKGLWDDYHVSQDITESKQRLTMIEICSFLSEQQNESAKITAKLCSRSTYH